MSTPEDDKLDSLMRGWADRHAASYQKLDDLTLLVCDRLVSSPERVATVATRRASSRRALAWAVGCGAAAASLALLIYVAERNVDSADPPMAIKSPVQRGPDSESLLVFTPLDIAEKELVLREMQQMFPGRFAWFMDSGSETELGLRTDENTQPAPVIAVRFVIESQRGEDRDWKILQKLDFVTVSEETVVASPGGDAGVSFWTYATPDGMISIDAELNLKGAVPIRVSSSHLTASGSAAEIWWAELDGVKYRIHQAAVIIDHNRVG